MPASSTGSIGRTAAEARLYDLVARPLFEDFVFANPERGDDDDRELADVLVYFQDSVVVFSSKELEPKAVDQDGFSKRQHLAATKHVRKAAAQARGAERRLQAGRTEVLQNARRGAVTFDAAALKRVHLLCILSVDGLLGASGFDERSDFKTVVHVMGESDLATVLGELDTAADFLAYLDQRATLLGVKNLVVIGGEEELLGYYILNGRSFAPLLALEGDHVHLDGDHWAHYCKIARDDRIASDKVSYLIDDLVNHTHQCEPREHCAPIAAALASLPRTERRSLATAIHEKATVAAREQRPAHCSIMFPTVGLGFGILVLSTERERRKEELAQFIRVAKYYMRADRAVGLATEPASNGTHTWDFCLLEEPWEFNEELDQLAQKLFRTPVERKHQSYPTGT